MKVKLLPSDRVRAPVYQLVAFVAMVPVDVKVTAPSALLDAPSVPTVILFPPELIVMPLPAPVILPIVAAPEVVRDSVPPRVIESKSVAADEIVRLLADVVILPEVSAADAMVSPPALVLLKVKLLLSDKVSAPVYQLDALVAMVPVDVKVTAPSALLDAPSVPTVSYTHLTLPTILRV